jgi:hypothetical protein
MEETKKEVPTDANAKIPTEPENIASDEATASQKATAERAETTENTTSSSPLNARETNLPDDGHKPWEWNTKYGKDAWKQIKYEFTYLAVLFFAALILLYTSYSGHLFYLQGLIHARPTDDVVFRKIMYCLWSGFLGGTVFSIKILYKAVAGGKWHQDRFLWRIATPWVSLALTIVIASFMSEDILSTHTFAAVAIGFFTGYFSESAIGKLYGIANVLFQ